MTQQLSHSFFKKEKIVVGGVPEHFNAPWHLDIAKEVFDKHNIEVEFKDIPEGTGKMCAGLKDGSLDVALVLTEGIVSDIAKGSNARLVATYVESPLMWGIFVRPDSTIQSVSDLKGKTIGISRYGSGSHLMSYVLADQQEWRVDDGDLTFEVVHNIQGLREGIKEKKIDAFLWENFMTKPHVDSGELRKIGFITTPWPCFMIAVRDEILKKHYNRVRKMLLGIEECAAKFQNGGDKSISLISQRYGLQLEDAKLWFDAVRFSPDGAISRRVLVKTIDTLTRAHVLDLDSSFSFTSLYDRRAKLQSIDSNEIRNIQLYYAQRMRNELKELGKDKGPLKEDDIVALDQLHYYDTSVVQAAGEYLQLSSSSRVLDIGSGLGGPARLLASTFGCHVTGVEIEDDRHHLAEELTNRCGLVDKVNLICGNFLATSLPDASFDHIVSWLVFLHISEKEKLFNKCFATLKPGGSLLIEDFVRIAPFTEQEKQDLEASVACPYVPGFREYQKELEAAGFVDVMTEDLSEDWTRFVKERLQDLEKERARHVRVHGEMITEGLHYFYSIIDKLFAGGNLGGIRIVGRKPL